MLPPLDSQGLVPRVLIYCSYLGLWIFGLTPFAKYYCVYQLYILLWFSAVTIICYTAIVHDIIGEEESLNDLISTIQFLAHMCGHLVILIDSWKMRSYRQPLWDKLSKIQKTVAQKLQAPLIVEKTGLRLSILIVLFGLLITLGHGLIIWTTFNSKSAATFLYWRSLPSNLALQFKTLEFLQGIVPANHFISVILKNINEMGERNLERVFKSPVQHKCKKRAFLEVLPVRQEQEDEQQLEIIKSCYCEIYSLFQIFNCAYGWSLLAATAVYFVDFVCNAYFILLLVITQGRDYYAMLQSACFALLAFVLLALLCWLCEESNLQSRYIGCLISKLVKPMGNKRYNDLVSEFSVQTLHQRFVVTAKEFFSLNLGLLGSMVAAIVTYLVILIQFMFTEKSRHQFEKKSIITTTLPILMNNMSSDLVTTTPMSLPGNATSSALQMMLANLSHLTMNRSGAAAMAVLNVTNKFEVGSNVTTMP